MKQIELVCIGLTEIVNRTREQKLGERKNKLAECGRVYSGNVGMCFGSGVIRPQRW